MDLLRMPISFVTPIIILFLHFPFLYTEALILDILPLRSISDIGYHNYSSALNFDFHYLASVTCGEES